MGYAVALGGKGGTGKTTVAGLLIRYMLNHGMKPLLAIDADSNSNLNDVLGVPLEETLSEAREEMKTRLRRMHRNSFPYQNGRHFGPDSD